MIKLRVTVDGKQYEVTVEVLGEAGDSPARITPTKAESAQLEAPQAAARPKPVAGAVDGAVASPLSGVVVKVLVKDGERVSLGQEVIVLEAMKMETPINAPKAGTVRGLAVTQGNTVEEGQPLFKLED